MKINKSGLIFGMILITLIILVFLQFNRYEIEKFNRRDGLLLDKFTGEVYVIDSEKKEKVNYLSLEVYINKQDKVLKMLDSIAIRLDNKLTEIKKYRDEAKQVLNEVKAIKSDIQNVQK